MENHGEEVRLPAALPLYITIGPPNCGKSTWLRNHNRRDAVASNNNDEEPPAIVDVTIDDQPGVYLPCPTEWFFDDSSGSSDQRLDWVTFGRSLRDRITQDNRELSWLLKQLSSRGRNEEESEHALIQILTANPPRKHNNNDKRSNPSVPEDSAVLEPWVDATVTTYQRVIRQQQSARPSSRLPSTTDLFIRDAIFRPPTPDDVAVADSFRNQSKKQPAAGAETSSALLSALDRAQSILETTGAQATLPVSWGNTNTQPREYAKALTMAAQHQRPVYFVVLGEDGDDRNKNMLLPPGELLVPFNNDSGNNQGHDMTLVHLLERNISRFQNTGRYIPARVVRDMLKRTRDFLNRVVQDPSTKPSRQDQPQEQVRRDPLSPLERDQRLAELAGFDMTPQRTVVMLPNAQQRPGKRPLPHSRHDDDYRRAPPHRHSRPPWDGRGGDGGGRGGRGGRPPYPNQHHDPQYRREWRGPSLQNDGQYHQWNPHQERRHHHDQPPHHHHQQQQWDRSYNQPSSGGRRHWDNNRPHDDYHGRRRGHYNNN